MVLTLEISYQTSTRNTILLPMSIFRLPPVLINIELGTLTPSKITSCFKTSKRVTKQKHKKKKKGTWPGPKVFRRSGWSGKSLKAFAKMRYNQSFRKAKLVLCSRKR